MQMKTTARNEHFFFFFIYFSSLKPGGWLANKLILNSTLIENDLIKSTAPEVNRYQIV
jgi:hypothetical protein